MVRSLAERVAGNAPGLTKGGIRFACNTLGMDFAGERRRTSVATFPSTLEKWFPKRKLQETAKMPLFMVLPGRMLADVDAWNP